MKKSKFSLHLTNEFKRELGKILKSKRDLARSVAIAIEKIKSDPFTVSLRTHSVPFAFFWKGV